MMESPERAGSADRRNERAGSADRRNERAGSADRRNERQFCPHYQKAIELVGRRWSGSILRALLDRPLRFSEISARIPEISDRALSLRLKELEHETIMIRRVEPTKPVTVSYQLTDKGRDLESAITALEKWAHDWIAPPEESSTESDDVTSRSA